MIEFIDISKFFVNKNEQFYALKNIHLKIGQGEIFGIIGKSGAGKSTLLRCANLLERPNSGKVILDGDDLTSLSEKQLRFKRRQIGMIFQHFNLLAHSTVFQNVALPLEAAGYSKRIVKERVEDLLAVTDLLDKTNRYPDELSGGQKQRVAIARALANNPKVLLCDEATSALDSETTKSILDLLKKINKEFNVTILLITHQIEVVKYVCHRLAVMEKGSLIEVSEKNSFFKNPLSKQGKNLLFVQNLSHGEAV